MGDTSVPTDSLPASSSVPGDMPSLQGSDSSGKSAPDPVPEPADMLPPVGILPPEDDTAPAGEPNPINIPSESTPPAVSDWGMGPSNVITPLETTTPVTTVGESLVTPPASPQESDLPKADLASGEQTVTTTTTTTTTPASDAAPAPGGETLVIPPAESSSENPFIPEGTAPPGTTAKSGGNPLVKRIVILLVILLVLLGLGIGAYFGLGFMNTSKEVTLTYWGLWENNATTQSVLDEFQSANPNIKVQYVKQSPRQYRERLQAAIARGEGPDVFEFHNTWVPMLRNELAPAPQTIMTTTEFSSTFYPVASADLVGGSSIYGIPMMIDGLGLYYNTDLFLTAGVTPPTTWPELVDIVPKLTVRTDSQVQKSAIALGTTGNVEHFSDIIALMMMQNGAKLITPTGKEAEDTLLFYRKFANPSDPVYTWNDSMDNSVYAFATGNAAMMIAPSWRAFDVKQINPSLNFKIVPVPQLPGNTINWASYWVEGVSTKSKNLTAAWTFVKYLTGRDTVSALYAEESKERLFGEPYARVDMASTLQSDPYVGAYITQASTAKSFPLASRTFDNGINDKMIKYMEDAINAVGAGTAPVEVLNTVSQGFSQVLSSYGLSPPAAAPTTTP